MPAKKSRGPLKDAVGKFTMGPRKYDYAKVLADAKRLFKSGKINSRKQLAGKLGMTDYGLTLALSSTAEGSRLISRLKPVHYTKTERQEVVSKIRDDYIQGLPAGSWISGRKYKYDPQLILYWLKQIDPDLYKELAGRPPDTGAHGGRRRKLTQQEVYDRGSKVIVSLYENPYKSLDEIAADVNMEKATIKNLKDQGSFSDSLLTITGRMKLYHLFTKCFSENREFKSVGNYAKAMKIHPETAYYQEKKLKGMGELLKKIRKDKGFREQVSRACKVSPDWWLKDENEEMAMIRLIWNY